ncbi:MAG TPA: GDP-mannose 4,6-dehydratase [Spirochaetota bacterium]|nr:GDP-mannose 4,6-dehydratase [Spirochaetota bacterium]
MTKRAIITGIRGQDGAYLAKNLLEKGYEVYGADRRSGDTTFWRLNEFGIFNDIKLLYMDLLELTNILRTIEKIKPDEVYNLAAQSFVGTSFEQPIITSDINAMGVIRLLEVLRLVNPGIKFYQASTSEMFGKVRGVPQNEDTPFHPRSPYGVAKLYAHWATVNYRESYNMFACSGILFNHESPLRGLEFVTKKITRAVAAIKKGRQDKVVLGNLDSRRDWGFAGDYVDGMRLMLQQEEADDYVLSTGETHSIREFVEEAFRHIDIAVKWQGEGSAEKGIDGKTGKVMVEVSPEFYRPAEVDLLIGDSSKAKSKLGWTPKVRFNELVQMMVEWDIRH